MNSPDYYYNVPWVIETKGAITVCGSVNWFVLLETSAKKDVNCTHGCFPVDDLIHVEVKDAGL